MCFPEKADWKSQAERAGQIVTARAVHNTHSDGDAALPLRMHVRSSSSESAVRVGSTACGIPTVTSKGDSEDSEACPAGVGAAQLFCQFCLCGHLLRVRVTISVLQRGTESRIPSHVAIYFSLHVRVEQSSDFVMGSKGKGPWPKWQTR